MNQRNALILAAAITAFALIIIVGIVAQINNAQLAATPTDVALVEAPTDLPAPVATDPAAMLQVMQEREAAYQQTIAEANQRIEQTNAQLQTAYEKQQELANQLNQAHAAQSSLTNALDQARNQLETQAAPAVVAEAAPGVIAAAAPVEQPTTAPAEPAAPTYAISPEQAIQIALSAAPGAQLTRQPELVLFESVPAYEVALDQGMVYVDANSGQVLYNGATIVQANTGGGHEREHEDGHEHEGEHDDD